jgi:hypothetical protein
VAPLDTADFAAHSRSPVDASRLAALGFHLASCLRHLLWMQMAWPGMDAPTFFNVHGKSNVVRPSVWEWLFAFGTNWRAAAYSGLWVLRGFVCATVENEH